MQKAALFSPLPHFPASPLPAPIKNFLLQTLDRVCSKKFFGGGWGLGVGGWGVGDGGWGFTDKVLFEGKKV